jgi:hypothetical protein
MKPEINHSSRKSEKMAAGWKPLRRRGDARYPSIKPETNHSSRKNGIMGAGWKSP